MHLETVDAPYILPRIQSLSELEDGRSNHSAQEQLARDRARAEHNYQRLPDLIARLLFAAVSGSDPEYIDRFLLMYRRFATPRAVLLRIQLRFRELSQNGEAPDSFDDFARFRLCTLLQYWAKLYPTDFYAPGTTGALRALYKTISSLPELIQYAARLQPFVMDVCEGKHSRFEDPAWEWALQETDPAILENDGNDENHETNSIIEELELDIDSALGPDPNIELDPISSASSIQEDNSSTYASSLYERNRANSASSTISSTTATPIASVFTQSATSSLSTSTAISMQSQEIFPRKLSSASPTLSSINEFDYVPFPAMSSTPSVPLLNTSRTRSARTSSASSNHSHVLKNLNGLLSQVHHTHSIDLAQEITRIQLNLFLNIEPRDWIRHILIKPQHLENPELEQDLSFKTRQYLMHKRSEHIWEFINFYNHLAAWVTSLILTHPISNLKSRARTAARFILVARELRALHNYSGLRAVVCGIMNATVEGDEMITILKEGEHKDLWKNMGSYIILMSSSKGHRHYRTAVSSDVCGVIPEAEIHTSDLQRTWSIQPDYHKDDSTRINWGKFATVAGIIEEITACQKRCRRSVTSKKFAFQERPQIRRWIEETEIMDAELTNSRMPPIESNPENGMPSSTCNNSPPQGGLQRIASLFKS